MPGLAVLGFHRSGTSMLAGILHQNQLSMGKDLLGASYSNPFGHFEDKSVIEINERILKSQGGAWYNDFALTTSVDFDHIVDIQSYFEAREAEEKYFGFKDPRLLVTLRSWVVAVPEIRILYIHRGFRRSCYSLWLRAHRDLKLGRAKELNEMLVRSKDGIVGLYLNNVQNFLSFWASDAGIQAQTAFIDYDSLQEEEVDLRRVLSRLGIDLPDITLEQYIDTTVINAEQGFRGEIESALVKSAVALDSQLKELCVTR